MTRMLYYSRYLQRYFDEHFREYDETALWHVDPAPNKWKFVIRELGQVITLTCDNNGVVTEERRNI